MLRSAARQRVFSQLEQSYFGIDNFAVTFHTDGEFMLEVSFLPNPQFIFRLADSDDEGHIYTWECPSIELVVIRGYRVDDFDEGLMRIAAWADRVREEVVAANPFGREIAALKGELERRLSELEGSLDDYFTSDEAQELEAKLGAFKTRLDSLEDENESLKESLSTMKQAVADLQSATTVVTKGTWYRMGSGRLLSALKSLATSKEAREFALEAAKKFLLEGPK